MRKNVCWLARACAYLVGLALIGADRSETITISVPTGACLDPPGQRHDLLPSTLDLTAVDALPRPRSKCTAACAPTPEPQPPEVEIRML
jgi:hypothetical protein